MEILKRYKFSIIAVLVFAAASFIYVFFFASGDVPDPLTRTGETAGSVSVDDELLAIVLSLRSLELDKDVFNSAEFENLTDFSRILIPEPLGRSNPFAPFDRSASRNAR